MSLKPHQTLAQPEQSMIELPSTDGATTVSRTEELPVKEVAVEVRERPENRIESLRRKSVFSYHLTAIRNSGHKERESVGQQKASSQGHAGRQATR